MPVMHISIYIYYTQGAVFSTEVLFQRSHPLLFSSAGLFLSRGVYSTLILLEPTVEIHQTIAKMIYIPASGRRKAHYQWLPNRMPGENVYFLSFTWLCTVLSWLLKVMVRLVEVLGATWVIKGVLLWLTVSYMFTRRLQISMFWKQDFTLQRQRRDERRTLRQASSKMRALMATTRATTGLVKLVLCAVRKIEEMRHGNKRVVERFDGGDPLVSVDGQHLG